MSSPTGAPALLRLTGSLGMGLSAAVERPSGA
jgi:hypothetical protein